MKSALEWNARQEEAITALLASLSGVDALALALWCSNGQCWRLLSGAGAWQALPAPGAEGSDSGVLWRELSVGGGTPLRAVCRAGAGQGTLLLDLVEARLAASWLQYEQDFNRQLQALLVDASRLALRAVSLEAFLSVLHRRLSRLFPAGGLVLSLSDETGGALTFPAPAFDLGAGLASVGRLQSALTEAVRRRGKPHLLDARRLQAFARQHGVPVAPDTLWLGLPLDPGGPQAGGVVSVSLQQSGGGRLPWQRLLCVVRHVFALLGQLGQRMRLEQRLRRCLLELEGSATRLNAEIGERRRSEALMRAMSVVAGLSNSHLSLEAFLAGVQRELCQLLAYDGFVVALCQPGEERVRFPFRVEGNAWCEQDPAEYALIERVLHSGQTVLLGAAALACAPDLPAMSRLHAWLGVALYDKHQLIGMMAVLSRSDGSSFGLRDQELLEFVAEHVGGALARLQATQALHQVNSQLEERVLERTQALDAVNEKLRHDSLHDALTRLPNRAYFGKQLEQLWQHYAAGDGACFALLFIDLDRFKLINDTLGHQAGDSLLLEAGSRIRHALRPLDFLARLGGDEFALLLPGVASLAVCEQVAQRILAEFARPMIVAGRELFATLSIGVALADRHHYFSCDELLRDADLAMYRTKQRGRDGYTLFNHAFRQDQADQLALEAELRHALDDSDQLLPYFQPFVDSISGRVTGFETLVRWQHPVHGLLSPGEFLPVAQASGLICRLDRYMISSACRQLAHWRRSGLADEALSLHVNLSSENLRDPNLPVWLNALLLELGLPPQRIYLEVTESALIDVPEQAELVMQALHHIGVRLALDDFGTGYSALSYLHRYRFDLLKIDQAFVREVDVHAESRAIVRAILALAAALQLEVVAEGVETEAQVSALRELGCPRMQGFYFARPLAADAVWSLSCST